MDTISKNKLTLEEEKLLNGLSDSLELPLYYYGSIQRNDYVVGKSDIDVAIFTDNENSILMKMQNYLHVNRYNFTRVLWKLKNNNTVTYGYKLKYNKNNMHIEFAIYNQKFKSDIIAYQNTTISIPFYITWMLHILKIIYYQYNLISLPFYSYLKRKIFSLVDGSGKEEEFIVLRHNKIR
jgi:hypothetical protein